MKIAFSQELNDPRAIEWMSMTRWVREYISTSGITTPQFVEAICDDSTKRWWVSRCLEAHDEIAPRRIVRGEDRYVKLKNQLAEVRAKIQAGEAFLVRQMKPEDVLEDVDISSLHACFPLYGTTVLFEPLGEPTKVDTTEYTVGTGGPLIATVYLMLVEDHADKMDEFISELARMYVTALSERGFHGILRIQSERGWMWC